MSDPDTRADEAEQRYRAGRWKFADQPGHPVKIGCVAISRLLASVARSVALKMAAFQFHRSMRAPRGSEKSFSNHSAWCHSGIAQAQVGFGFAGDAEGCAAGRRRARRQYSYAS